MHDDYLAGSKTHSRDAETAGEETISDLEESLARFFDITLELAILSDIVERVEHGFTWDAHMVEHESAVVNAIETHLPAHVFDHDALAGLHFVVTNAHDKTVHAFVLAVDPGLGKHDCVVRVACPIRDPELLGQGRWRVDHELLLRIVISGRRFHLGRIITIPQLGETEAAHVLKAINILHERQMPLRMESHQRPAKQVKLHRELGRQVTIKLSQHLMCSKNVLFVILEVKDGDEFLI